MDKPKIYKVGVYLPISICIEVVATNEDDAIESAKDQALRANLSEWNDDFSRATAEILETHE